MIFFRLFRRKTPEPGTAPLAKERLEVVLVHDRAATGQIGLIGALKKEVIAAIARHMKVSPKTITVKVDKKTRVQTLRIAVELPR
jgi:cell division topological specificity factor